jgi:hypothetical protein
MHYELVSFVLRCVGGGKEEVAARNMGRKMDYSAAPLQQARHHVDSFDRQPSGAQHLGSRVRVELIIFL